MSGIVAGVQSGGCCCRPQQGCTCSSPTRPGALVDASLTAINIDAQLDHRYRWRQNKRIWCGDCPCRAFIAGIPQGPVWGQDPAGPYYVYRSNACIVDPDFTDGSECESLACRPGGCACCPEYGISVNFGNQILERVNQFPFFNQWATVFRHTRDHKIGTWNWSPSQVGYCVDPNNTALQARVRRSCFFYYYMSGNYDPGSGLSVDPNGQYLTPTGNYTGANVGLLNVYASANVTAPGPNQCFYEASLAITYRYQVPFASLLQASGNYLVEGGSAFLVYRKPCTAPTDTVLGTYECVACEPTYTYSEDQECGPQAVLDEFDETPPATILIS